MEKIRDLKVKILLELDEACQNSAIHKKLILENVKKYKNLNNECLKKLSKVKLYQHFIIPSWDELEYKYESLLDKNVLLSEELSSLQNAVEHEKKKLNNLLNFSFKYGNQNSLVNDKRYKKDFNKYDDRKNRIENEIENLNINMDKACMKRKSVDEIIIRMVADIKTTIGIFYLVTSNLKITRKSNNKIFQFSKTNTLSDRILLFEDLSYEKSKDSWLLFVEKYIRGSFIYLPLNKNIQSFYQFKINDINGKINSQNLILKIINEVLVEGENRLMNVKKDIEMYEKLYVEEDNKLKLSNVVDVSFYDYINDKFVMENMEEEFYIANIKLKIQKEWIEECKKFFCEISSLTTNNKNLLYNDCNFFTNKLNNNNGLQKKYLIQALSHFNQIKKLKREIRLIGRSFVARKNEKFLLNEEIKELKSIVKELEKKEKEYDKSFFSTTSTIKFENDIYSQNDVKKINYNNDLENVRMVNEINVNLINNMKAKIDNINNDIKNIVKEIEVENFLYSKISTQLRILENKLISQKQPLSTTSNYYNKLLQEKSLLVNEISFLKKQLLKGSEIRMNIIKKTIT
uniref:PH domain-containing protein n=1 Tax=Strongyloides papillosus TaxID=174720 RepID=A0A0N5BYQ6_STREA